MPLFNERLKELRKIRKITQKTLSSAIGVTERYCQEMEYGKTKPGFDILIALADFFDVSLDYLVGRSDVPHSRAVGRTTYCKGGIEMNAANVD